MTFWRDGDTLIARYLLGELSESRRSRLEERMLADEDFYERILVAEGELIDAYVGDQLTAHRRPRFEARFLSSPTRRARVELARDLTAAAKRARDNCDLEVEPEPLSRWPALAGLPAGLRSQSALPAVAAASLLLVAVLVWRPWIHREGGFGSPRLAATTALVLLPSVRSEAAELPRLELAAATGVVELKAWVEDKRRYRSYRARLNTGRGDALWESDDGSQVESTEQDPTVVVRLSADVLRLPAAGLPGVRHILTLEGVDLANELELIDEYEFEVVRVRDIEYSR